jgi:uncharacterized Zn-finger protein
MQTGLPQKDQRVIERLSLSFKHKWTNAMTEPAETVEVERADVDCDGGGGALGHPRVFLNIKTDIGHLDCPYCGKRFILKSASNATPE